MPTSTVKVQTQKALRVRMDRLECVVSSAQSELMDGSVNLASTAPFDSASVTKGPEWVERMQAPNRVFDSDATEQ